MPERKFEQVRPIVHHGKAYAVSKAGGKRYSNIMETRMNWRAIALLSMGHFLIDFSQGVVPALLPFFIEERHFTNFAAGSLIFAMSATSSVVQPIFGQLADKLALAWLLPASILLAGVALLLGAQASNYGVVLWAFALSGLGVAAFHPEAARKAHLASGDRRTTGMSLFSVGGGLGFALAPAITRQMMLSLGTPGLLILLVPTSLIAWSLFHSKSTGPPTPHLSRTARHVDLGQDNWRGFWILSVATICRSIVFYGFNTFLSLYFMSRWHQSAAQASRASVVFLGTSIFGTLLGGWLADRVGRRTVVRWGFGVGTLLFAIFTQIPNETWALAALIPLAIFVFLPTSVLVVLGQEYLPNRVGMASGVTLGLAVSVGGMCAPFLGILADHYGIEIVLLILTGTLLIATLQTFLLPPAGASESHRDSQALIKQIAVDPPVPADRSLAHRSASSGTSASDR